MVCILKQNTHHSFLVAVDHVDDALRVFVPEEDVAAIGSRDNKFTLWSVKIYTLDWKKSQIQLSMIKLWKSVKLASDEKGNAGLGVL